jgi:RNA polymerase sigma factor (TIGR02999 family)
VSTSTIDLLRGARGGDEPSRRRLFDLLYRELHAIASRLSRAGGRRVTLQTTALIHEAYLRLVGEATGQPVDRQQFLALAATVMRHVLVDHVRARNAAKRGGSYSRVPLDDVADAYEERAVDLERLDAALERFRADDARACAVVELHFFAGLSLPEVARVLDASLRTVERQWAYARAWLREELA